MSIEEGATIPAATGTESVPENLKKFIGEDGKIDVAKLSQSYLESEKSRTQESQRRADLERAYQASLRSAPDGTGYTGDGREADEDAGTERPITYKETAPFAQALLEMQHPEIALDPATGGFKAENQGFIDGLKSYIRTLPMDLQQSIAKGSFEKTHWALNQYKALRKAGSGGAAGGGAVQPSSGSARPNFIEGGSVGASGTEKTWTHSEIRSLIRDNPNEYAKKADEIFQAIQQGRVK